MPFTPRERQRFLSLLAAEKRLPFADMHPRNGRGHGWSRAASDRRGFTLIELIVVVLISSIIAAIAQPRLNEAITKARAVDAIADMNVVRLAVFNYQTDQQGWPPDAARGVVPTGLDAYPPANFAFETDDYTLDFDNGGGSPFFVGITLSTPDQPLGTYALEMLASPKWQTAPDSKRARGPTKPVHTPPEKRIEDGPPVPHWSGRQVCSSSN